MGEDWIETPHAKAVQGGLAAAEFGHLPHPQVAAILDGLDAAGLLVTADRLDEIATQIEANERFASVEQRPALKAAAAIVRTAARR